MTPPPQGSFTAAGSDAATLALLSRKPSAPVPPPPSSLSRAAAGLKSFARRSPMAAFWGIVSLAIVAIAIAAPVLAPYDPLQADFLAMNKPPIEGHVFGTDQIGRDTLSRVIHGSRTSLVVAISAVLLGTTLGSIWGLASGFLGGRFDLISQRIIEFLQSFPDL
ncbi:MAG: hypothetical protein RIM80_16355, partial [Alphaproteobacteria bacterium]